MKNNFVLITAINSPHKPQSCEGYKYSIESWKVWCNANKCELRVLDEPLFPLESVSPIYFRHYWHKLLADEAVNQVCLVDADTIVHPRCPNFFELSDHNFCAVHNDGDYDWIIRSIENYQHEFPTHFTKKFDIWKYFNTGFMITNPTFILFHEKLMDFYWENDSKVREVQKKYGVGTDQPICNLIINENDIYVKLLPYQFNMQDLARKNILDDRMLFTDIPGIYHFNAMEGGVKNVNHWLKKTYEYLYDNCQTTMLRLS